MTGDGVTSLGKNENPHVGPLTRLWVGKDGRSYQGECSSHQPSAESLRKTSAQGVQRVSQADQRLAQEGREDQVDAQGL